MSSFTRFIFVFALVAGCTVASAGELTTIRTLDLKRYMGLWYEVARKPNLFEHGCVEATANYTLNGKASVKVENSCLTKSGNTKVARGKATIPDANVPSKLKVSFFWPFKGDYWILDLGADYEYALIGEPKKKNLWILSRTPVLPAATFNALVAKAQAQGYDTSDLYVPPKQKEALGK